MTRGILYIVWGNKSEAVLGRSIESAKQLHPELPVEVKRLDQANLLDKAKMLEFSPFDETLYLDADTVLLGRVDYGFSRARDHDLACAICECPWANRYPSIKGDIVEYNTGVIFFRRCDRVKALFALWQSLNDELDSSIKWRDDTGKEQTMNFNDQCGFASACHTLSFSPFVLPMNFNFRPRWHKSWFGSIRIWHDYDDPKGRIADREAMEFFYV